MKNRNRIYRAAALLMILALLLTGVSGGADVNDSDAPSAVYSGWLRLDELLGGRQDQNAPSGTQDLSLLLRRAILLDEEGNVLAEEGEWLVKPDTAYRIRLRFRETPGNEELQFAADNGPLVFRLPQGLSIGDQNLTLPVRIVLDPGETAEAVCVCDAAAGTLSVSWDEGSGIPEKIRKAPGAGFDIVLPAVFGDADTLIFSDDLTVRLRQAKKASLAAEETDYAVSVTYWEQHIPENARVVTAELTESDPRYQTFLDEASKALECGPEELTHSRLFDISIAAPDGSAVQPEGPVKVRVGYAEPLRFKVEQRFLVVHLSEEGTELLVPDPGRNADGLVDSFTFETGSFSPYGIVSAPRGGTRAAQQSSNLADFLDSIEIFGAEKNEQGQYVILDGVPYTIRMNFSEKINGVQFAEGEDGVVLTYQFPNGFRPNPTPEPGTVEMTGDGGVVRFFYTIGADGLMTITFDQTSEGYPSFIASETAQFEIHATGVITEEEIEFSSEVSGQFDIDNEREVSVRKTGAYDAALNRVRFTIQAQSKGNNTDVHIGDIITGTALTYDPASLTVSSSQEDPVQYQMETREGETFGLTIPAMSHGETVTIEYWADVNLSELEGSGPWTAELTGNSVKITSEEDHPGDDDHISDEDFSHRISLSTNRKEASSQIIRDGKTYITWTIVLNENANISLAGRSVTDTIDASCRSFMRYSGSGIHIEKFEKDGSPAGSADIPWGEDGLTASHGAGTWTYTIPESDAGQNYRYVITYETEVDSDTFLNAVTVGNKVENEYDSDSSWEGVEPTGDTVEAHKTALQSIVDAENDEAETEWEITFTVPPDGLSSAVITDTMPARLDYERMIWFYDAYQSGSVRVDGLLQGEGFSVDSESQEHRVVISFTKNNGEPGLNGTGLSRTISVKLKTTASHEWLEYAETHSDFRTHVNNAVVRVNGQDIAVSDSVSYNTTAYDLEKVFDENSPYFTSTDPALPIYVYKIILTGVNEDAFDSDGFITFTDTYDSEYLAFYPTYETTEGYNVNTPNGHVYGNTQWNKYGMVTRGPYVVSSSSEGQLVFRLNKDDLPMASQSSYYPYYAIVYALQVKDAETLARMKDEALHNDGLKVELANTAWNDQFGADTIVTEYTVKALEKTLIDEEDNSSTGTHDLHFSIAVNENGLKIGEGDTITLKDTISNLSFDYTSIVIEPQLEGDILNRTGNSVIFTLHNETPYTITYTARLVGIHDVHWNNKAVLSGYISGVSGTSSSQAGGSGTYGTFRMNVWKYAEGNMNQGLGATFELYEARVKDADGQDIAKPAWQKVSEFTTDGTTGRYQIRTVMSEGETAGRSLRPYSFHDDNGNEQFGTGETYGWRYRIKETIAPPGYQKTVIEYEFGISDIPSYAAPYNYLNGDTVTIVNKPVGLPADTEISGEKVLNGKNLEDQEFSFSLRPEESVLAVWGEEYPGGFDGFLTAKNDADGHFSFQLSFTYDDYLEALEKGFADENQSAYFFYVVQEELPNGVQDYFWNGVQYDDSKFLVRIRLYMEGDQLRTEKKYFRYDGNVIQ